MSHAERRAETIQELTRARTAATSRAHRQIANSDQRQLARHLLTYNLNIITEVQKHVTGNVRNTIGAAILADRMAAYLQGTSAEQTVDHNQALSYLNNKGKLAIPKSQSSLEEPFDRNNRQHFKAISLSKFTQIIPHPSDQRDGLGPYLKYLEYLVSLMGELRTNNEIQVQELRGQAIIKAYRDASLGSCMHNPREHAGANYLNVYADSDSVSLLTTYNDKGELRSRALLWRAVDAQGKPAVLLDRIYPGDGHDAHAEAIRTAAQNLGMTHEYSRNDPAQLYTVVKRHPGVPYFDTFARVAAANETHLLLGTKATEGTDIQGPDGRQNVLQHIGNMFLHNSKLPAFMKGSVINGLINRTLNANPASSKAATSSAPTATPLAAPSAPSLVRG